MSQEKELKVNIHRKNKRKNQSITRGQFIYLCPIKGCKHDGLKLSDTSSLFKHLLDHHDDIEINRRFKLKKAPAMDTNDGKQITIPHDIYFYVDGVLNESSIIDEERRDLTNTEQVTDAIQQMINTKTVFGLIHQETVSINSSVTHIHFASK